MKDVLTLNDKTTYEIEDNATLSNIVIIAENEEAALEIVKKITDENISHIEFSKVTEDQYGDPKYVVYGEYDDLVKVSVNRSEEMDEEGEATGKVIVTISLRVKTDVEKRLDKIEAEQEMQNEAIDFLAME